MLTMHLETISRIQLSSSSARCQALDTIGDSFIGGITCDDAMPCITCMRMTASYKAHVQGSINTIYLCTDCVIHVVTHFPNHRTTFDISEQISKITSNRNKIISILAGVCSLGGEIMMLGSKSGQNAVKCTVCPNNSVADIMSINGSTHICNNCRITIEEQKPIVCYHLIYTYRAAVIMMHINMHVDILPLLCWYIAHASVASV